MMHAGDHTAKLDRIGAAAGFVLVGVVAAAVSFVANGRPGERHYWLPGAIAVVTLVVQGWVVRHKHWDGGWVVAALLGAAAAVVLVPTWSVEQRVRDAQPTLDTTAIQLEQQASKTNAYGCRDLADGLHVGAVGTIRSVCVFGGTVPYVTLWRTANAGLAYVPSGSLKPVATDTCVNHLYGSWWEVAHTKASSCPSGSDFVGA